MQKNIAAVLTALISCLMITTAMADQFCDGFDRGYITGYKRASGNSMDPMTPLCPMQPMKRLSDPESDFEHGYVIGLQKGYEAANRYR